MEYTWYQKWFDSPYSGLLYSHRNKVEAAKFLDALLRHLQLASDARVLDLGCGNGRHILYLADKGFQVTGIDISKNRIITAPSDAMNVEFYTHDMRQPFRINYYDLVMNLFTSFGYFRKETENIRVVKSAVLAMQKGAYFIIDYLHKESVEQQFQESEVKKIEGVDFFIQRTISDGCIHSTINVHDKGKRFTFTEMVRLYSTLQLENILKSAGLSITGKFGDYGLSPLNDSTSDRCIIMAQKV